MYLQVFYDTMCTYRCSMVYYILSLFHLNVHIYFIIGEQVLTFGTNKDPVHHVDKLNITCNLLQNVLSGNFVSH